MVLIISILSFLTVMLFSYGIYLLVFWKRIALKYRLSSINHQDDHYFDSSVQEKLGFREQFREYSLNISKKMPKSKYLDKRKKKLNQAAIPMKAEEFMVISILTGIVIGGLIYLSSLNILLFLVGLIIGFSVPDIILEIARKRRNEKLNHQLPEALIIISNGLRAGYGFTQAMTVAANELSDPISADFSKIVRDNSMGKPVEEALEEFANRSENEDVDMFVTALMIQRQVGGNLAEILDTIADTIRGREQLKGEIKTLTSANKFSAVVISVLPIALAVVISIMNPTYMETLYTTSIGLIMISFAVGMEILGIFALWKIVNIDI